MLGQRLGHYTIVEQIGAGGMGVVYRAHDERLSRDVALKVLPPGVLADQETRQRFRTEALALSRLNHPNIATVYDFDEDQGVEFLAMELVRGNSLRELAGAGVMAEKEVVGLGIQLARGLDAAHSAGVVHRDLKPENLIRTQDGLVKILDFGVAKLDQRALAMMATTAITQPGAMMGTFPYMPPEQLPMPGRTFIPPPPCSTNWRRATVPLNRRARCLQTPS